MVAVRQVRLKWLSLIKQYTKSRGSDVLIQSFSYHHLGGLGPVELAE